MRVRRNQKGIHAEHGRVGIADDLCAQNAAVFLRSAGNLPLFQSLLIGIAGEVEAVEHFFKAEALMAHGVRD